MSESLITNIVQPWDPVLRLFTDIDPAYPLVGDLGADGVTLYASGPKRLLRPLMANILSMAPTWPSFRELYAKTNSTSLEGIGECFVLLPSETVYIRDRFVAVSIAVPEVGSVVSVPWSDLLGVLKTGFPLDVFSISFVPAALRSFVHHFHPAYALTLQAYEDGKDK